MYLQTDSVYTRRQHVSRAWVTLRRMRIPLAPKLALAAVAASLLAAPVAAATVVTIGGTGAGLNPHPAPWHLPYTGGGPEVNVAYPGSPVFMDASISAGADQLDRLIAQREGVMTVAGISQGALVIAVEKARLMALPEAERPPAGSIKFVAIGDPSNPYGGVMRLLPGGLHLPGVGVTVVHAPEVPWDTVYVTHEYDGFADYPDRFNLLSIANAVAGIVYVHARTDYADVDLDEVPADHVTETTNGLGGKTTSYLVATAHLPLLQVLRDLGVPEHVLAPIEAALKPIVDSGYSRNDAKPAEPAPAPRPAIEVPEPRPATVPAVAPVSDADDDQGDEPAAAKPAKHDEVRLSPIAKPGKVGVEPEGVEADVEAPAASSPSTGAGEADTSAPSPVDGPRGAAQGDGTDGAGSAADGGASAAA
ncbi:hydrolase [Mycobacterium phage LeMond]|nr:hydrolase [Mycobacterium phage LeMond]